MLQRILPLLALALSVPAPATAQSSFVNWENPHVHPLELTSDGVRLLAVNTADDRLEVFDSASAELVALPPIAVGIDPVSVRARTNTEAWVVNHISDSVSVVDLVTGRVVATLATDDEPCDVIFAGSPERAFVSCSQANTVLVFDPLQLGAPPLRIAIDAEDPRALAKSPDGATVYAAVFESGNGSTVLGGSSLDGTTFASNVVDFSGGPHGGVNPPPNDGASFTPAQKPGNPAPPRVSLIVKQDGAGNWLDDNGGDWTALTSGAQANLSGRPVGWNLPDRDVAVIDATTLDVSYVSRLMNIDMALAVRPSDGFVTVIGTDATNEIRFEPNLTGTFVRAQLALVDPMGPSSTVVDLNPHLTYATSNVAQSLRDQALGDPRGIVWDAAGARAYVTGMGSNNVIVIDAGGARAGLAPTIEVGEGPTGIVLDEAAGRAFVLDKFEAAVSVVDLTSETETARVAFFDPSPTAIQVGRKHLYDTHLNSGLGQVACAACHVDARMDRLAWDLGNPAGDMKSVAGQNLAANIPGLGGFEDFHPMKGPMLTQTMQDIIGKEPHHWRGDRDGLEEFAGAFVGLQGDDAEPSATAMQEFEDFLATIHFPPNPFREFDNDLPGNLPLPGHFATGRFGPAGVQLPDGDPQHGLTLYRPPNFLDASALACVTCHTLPTGLGTDFTLNFLTYVGIAPGPNGERHHALVPVDGVTNISMKVPQLRNLYERTGFNYTQSSNRAGFGFLHDGSVSSVEEFISEPIFSVTSDQDVADLTAFMLAFSGSDLPGGSTGGLFEPPGTLSQDTHAAVGVQTSLVDVGTAPTAQINLINDMRSLANMSAVGLVAKSRQAGRARGYAYVGGDTWQSDRLLEVLSTGQLMAAASPGSEVVFTVVPKGSELRIGIDRDEDGAFDRDELDSVSDPADAASTPSSCGLPTPSAPVGLVATGTGTTRIQLTWSDTSAVETAFRVERAPAGSGSFTELVQLPADAQQFTDIGLECATAYDYRVTARSCGGTSAAVNATGMTQVCELLRADTSRISLQDGGTQVFTLEAGAAHAGQLYWMLGSATGTSPGFPSPPFNVPLNFDNYFVFTLQFPNLLIANSLSFLSVTGGSTASLTLPDGLSGLEGIVLHHAYLVFDNTTLDLLQVSNAVPLTLAP